MTPLPETVLEVLRTKRKMTVEEYMQLPETNIHMELIDGELYVYDGQVGNMPAPKDNHQKISARLFSIFLKYLSVDDLRYSPTDVHLHRGNIVQPDIFWINPQNPQCVLMADGYLHGAPDFVVEILSPGTSHKDRGIKFDLYEQNGVHEYWLVDPDEGYIEVYTRHENTLRRQGLYTSDQTLTSKILGNTSIALANIFPPKE